MIGIVRLHRRKRVLLGSSVPTVQADHERRSKAVGLAGLASHPAHLFRKNAVVTGGPYPVKR
jgi:hypothetical protein